MVEETAGKGAGWTHLPSIACAVALLAAGTAASAAGQTLVGRVLEGGSDRPIPGALIRVLEGDDEAAAMAISDSVGMYALRGVPRGEYWLTGEAYGYASFRSHLLAIGDRTPYLVDIELDKVPLPLPGVVVSADRYEDLEEQLRLILGTHPRSLRIAPVLRPAIEGHVAKAHNLTDLIRWQNQPSLTVVTTDDGPCFRWRQRGCLSVFLNGTPLSREMVPVLPLDMIETIVITVQQESAAYGAAVLLYTSAWIAR